MIFGKNTLVKIDSLPQSSVGAPIPVVLSDERNLLLCYYTQTAHEDWDGTTIKIVDPDTADEMVAIITFDSHSIYKFGPPNDEAIAGHPLHKKGLKPYSIYEVRDSSWIAELEKMNSVHPYHKKERYASLKHFIFVFHDSTFECVAKGVSAEVKADSVRNIVKELAERL